jgi:hypothetical protein
MDGICSGRHDDWIVRFVDHEPLYIALLRTAADRSFGSVFVYLCLWMMCLLLAATILNST